ALAGESGQKLYRETAGGTRSGWIAASGLLAASPDAQRF
ncbi:MAG: hypothetical protein ACI9S9_003791, partial [Planctomycetota bacterium]